ncbi:DNA-packaging protein [Crassaminicella thermophila]|uniref:DNA-packaging protein n=1 Tax=Crassaminicella thermophila TaxID=2599308 RepID=A0A5C0SGQ7_CRATE|nr:head-tail connector protein [Crassaminicella thermophila]QEK12584.1 DNA-packaging protein [Crassaminicella thermophila]
MLEKIKNSLRIDDDSFDMEIQDLINAAKADLKLSGVVESKIVELDPLIIRAIKTFCKAEFSSDDKEADRYKESYESIKCHLLLSTDYNTDVIA